MSRTSPLPAVLRTSLQLPAFYEQSYAEQMAWRRNKGISAEEVAKVSKSRE